MALKKQINNIRIPSTFSLYLYLMSWTQRHIKMAATALYKWLLSSGPVKLKLIWRWLFKRVDGWEVKRSFIANMHLSMLSPRVEGEGADPGVFDIFMESRVKFPTPKAHTKCQIPAPPRVRKDLINGEALRLLRTNSSAKSLTSKRDIGREARLPPQSH